MSCSGARCSRSLLHSSCWTGRHRCATVLWVQPELQHMRNAASHLQLLQLPLLLLLCRLLLFLGPLFLCPQLLNLLLPLQCPLSALALHSRHSTQEMSDAIASPLRAGVWPGVQAQACRQGQPPRHQQPAGGSHLSDTLKGLAGSQQQAANICSSDQPNTNCAEHPPAHTQSSCPASSAQSCAAAQSAPASAGF